jgi:hypothetical protein
VLDAAVVRRNCKLMLDTARELGVGFRAHVKTHKVSFEAFCVMFLWVEFCHLKCPRFGTSWRRKSGHGSASYAYDGICLERGFGTSSLARVFALFLVAGHPSLRVLRFLRDRSWLT